MNPWDEGMIVWPCGTCGHGVVLSPMREECDGMWDLVTHEGLCEGPDDRFPDDEYAYCGAEVVIKVREPAEVPW